MNVKSFARFLTPHLILDDGTREWNIAPPSVADGSLMAALLNVSRAAASGDTDDVVDPHQQTLVDSIAKDRPVGSLSLGQSTYDDMVDAGLSAQDIDRMGLYALYYWVYGEQAADTFARILWDSGSDIASDDAGPKEPTPGTSTTGHSTASENPTITESIPTTARPRKTSSRDRAKTPAASTPSPGTTSSSSGTSSN